MFTGIVQGTRSVTAVEELEGGRRLRIQLDNLAVIMLVVVTLVTEMEAVMAATTWLTRERPILPQAPGDRRPAPR